MEFIAYKEERDFTTNEERAKVHNAVHNLLVKADSMTCKGCGKEFDTRDLEIHMYDHDGGWNIGLEKKQWLSILCEHCGYHTSFSKLRIGR
jgi:hypothetical protein